MRAFPFAAAFPLLHCLHAAEITWDNGAGTPSNPNVSFHADDNWDTDTVPGAGDTVRILTHGGVDPVRLSLGAVEISSIVCKVPFSLGDSLQVSNPSEFENSLVTGAFGFLKANGEISLKGENHPRLVTLEGLAGFRNFGNFSIDSRPVNAFFTNLDGATFTLASGQTTLLSFDNFGLLDLGATGGISSASHIENEGVVSKSNPASSSVISGTYIQDGGRTEVTNLGMLSITGASIELNGGTLKSDGIFFLGSAGGATPNNVYDGLTAIDGSGQVFQKGKFLLKKDLNLNLPGGVGYQIENDLTFKEGATLTNSKTMTIVSTPDFVPVTGQPPGTFRNAAGALVVQANSNPSLLIPVENVGTWEAGSFVPLNFRNTGTLRFRDAGNRITNPNGTTGTLTNATGGRVEHSQGEDATTDTKISTDYNQEGGATTHIETGILTLDGGSAGLNGLFEIPVTGQLVIEKGNYLTKGGDLRFSGTGKARIGGSQLAPVLDFTTPGSSRSGIVTSKLGLTENGTILDPAIGFSFENGTVILDFEFENQGMFIWKGGKFVSALDAAGNAQTGFFQNMNRLDIVPTRAKTFDGMLTNSISGEIVGLIRQSDSVRFLRPDEFGATEEGGRIKNFGTHLLLANGHLSGGNGLTSVPDFDDDAEDASYYLPPGGELIADSGGTNNVDCSLANFGLIESRGTSVLAISKCLNLMNEGGLWVLRRGQWYSHPAARILFQEDIDILATDWTGPGPGKITGLTSPEGVLTKTTTETHTNPITVTDGAELKTTEDCIVTMPACTFGSGGTVSGEGTIFLSVPMDIGDGSVEPGIEGTPGGKLTVGGGVDFSSAAILKIEIGNGEADELEVPTGTASLGGSVVPILTDNTIPPPGSSFTILYGPTVTGVFDFIDHSRLPAGASFAATYAPTTAILVSQAPPATTTLAEWEGRNFSIDDLLDDLISGPDADPDKDGLKNQQEYLHGLPPKAPGLSPVELSGSGPGYIEITFPWLKAAQDGEFSPQLSGNLTGFQDTAYTVVAETDEGAITRYTLRVPFSTAPAFVRLRTQIVSE